MEYDYEISVCRLTNYGKNKNKNKNKNILASCNRTVFGLRQIPDQ